MKVAQLHASTSEFGEKDCEKDGRYAIGKWSAAGRGEAELPRSLAVASNASSRKT